MDKTNPGQYEYIIGSLHCVVIVTGQAGGPELDRSGHLIGYRTDTLKARAIITELK